ncbi:HEAT repeat domain-containing protein [Kribbella sp. NPDC006257]|uniref:HEAT repeat domain-containing protein n=1 Tax=Kribbella sp. NPDC006257 TaxID=3156738 RepID=UPI0033AEDEB2
MLIGEVARRSGVSSRMLRHYDTLGLVRPTGRTVGGYREYSADDIRRIFHVESLRSLGLSLRQIGRALDDPAFTPAELVGDLIRRTEERLRQDQELLDRLRSVDASEPFGWEDALRIIELLHGLNSPDAARRQQTVLAPPDDVPVPTDVLARAVLTETDPIVAGALRWALARSGDESIAGLAEGVRAKEVEIRRRAVQAIAGLPGTDALLGEALADEDPTVRQYAALALGKRGAIAAVPALVELIVEGINDVEAAETLGALAQAQQHSDQIMTALTAELSSADSAVRIRVIQALAEMPSPVALPVLRDLTHDADKVIAMISTAFVKVLEENG